MADDVGIFGLGGATDEVHHFVEHGLQDGVDDIRVVIFGRIFVAIAQECHVMGHEAPRILGEVEHGVLVEIEEILERLHAAMDKRFDQFGLDEHHATLEIF